MNIFGKLKEALRDKTRDDVCTYLNMVGVDAKLAERGIAEEKATVPRGRGSLGLIEIRKSPIHFVHVVVAAAERKRYYTTLLLAHDPSVHDKGRLKARSKRVKERLLIGKVIDVVWKGNLGEDIIERLNNDQHLKQELIRLGCDVTIGTCPDIGYWKIEPPRDYIPWVRKEWKIFEKIGHHLNPQRDG